ncbi:hypothetical protein HPB48_016305 [Haemaphysalis longicornis]|uniref:Uncharacterized protein n=1 Tax=Haemaphysalis longicornis TaxID=44386 RepID=A0A9J6FC23_HAELO|nr:hypothetical protein HPB48_016305 [Haemaphysalis longicornis]
MNEGRMLTPTLKSDTNNSEVAALKMKFQEMHQRLATVVRIHKDFWSHNDIIKAVIPDLSITSLLRRLHVKVLDVVEVISQEAACIILRLAMPEVSRKVIFIPIMPAAERIRVRKSVAETDADNVAAGSNDVWKFNAIQKYEDRAQTL